MFHILIWVVGILFTLVRGSWMTLLGSDLLDLDLLTIIIGYLFLAYGPLAAGIFAFGQGLVADLLAGGLEGVSTAVYLGVFGTVYLGRRFFDLEGPKGQFIIVSLAVLVKKGLFLALLFSFALNLVMPERYAVLILGSALITGLASPVAFHLFGRLKSALSRERPKGSVQVV